MPSSTTAQLRSDFLCVYCTFFLFSDCIQDRTDLAVLFPGLLMAETASLTLLFIFFLMTLMLWRSASQVFYGFPCIRIFLVSFSWFECNMGLGKDYRGKVPISLHGIKATYCEHDSCMLMLTLINERLTICPLLCCSTEILVSFLFAPITSRRLQNKRNLFHLRMTPTLDKLHRKDEVLQTGQVLRAASSLHWANVTQEWHLTHSTLFKFSSGLQDFFPKPLIFPSSCSLALCCLFFSTQHLNARQSLGPVLRQHLFFSTCSPSKTALLTFSSSFKPQV